MQIIYQLQYFYFEESSPYYVVNQFELLLSINQTETLQLRLFHRKPLILKL